MNKQAVTKSLFLSAMMFAFLLQTSILLAALQPGATEMGSATDTGTGVTTTVYKNPDGSRTVTKTDTSGREIGREEIPVREPGSISGSTRNPDGTITEYEKKPGKNPVVTKKDAKGKVISKREILPEPVGGSAFDPKTKVTTAVLVNPDGSHTITKTGSDGKVIEKVTVPPRLPLMADTPGLAPAPPGGSVSARDLGQGLAMNEEMGQDMYREMDRGMGSEERG